MDTIKYLIGFFFKLAFAAMFIALVWWLVSLLFPALSFSQVKSLVSGEQKRDLLPSPKAYSGLIKSVTAPTPTTNLYVHGKAFDGYESYGGTYTYSTSSASFVSYSSRSASATTSQPTAAPTRSMYIRNLSIYENGHVYTGLSFVGEARNEMFRNGAFTILTVDSRGAVIGVSRASSTGAWSVPGWSRFSTRIDYVLPPGGIPCSMIFEQGRESQYSGITTQPVRVGIPIKCN